MAEHRMRVAVAGTNTLALLIAAFVVRDTSHQIIVLSRTAQTQLVSQGYTVLVVDYDNPTSLKHAVTGVHTIISTVTGPAQIELLKAAVNVGVRRFAPAEFNGPPDMRPAVDPLDRGKKNMRTWLDYYGSRIQHTVFVCGVLYERFAPGGLHAHRLGLSTEVGREGDFIINLRNLTATAPYLNADNEPVTMCLTAAQDVARLVVRSLDLRSWPRELVMAGEKLTVAQLVAICLRVRGRTSLNNLIEYTRSTLVQEVHAADVTNDAPRMMRAQEHVALVAQRYVFRRPGNLRERNPDVTMIRFEDWLRHAWAGVPVDDES